MMQHRVINGEAVAHVVFEASDTDGHRKEVDEFMAWLGKQPAGSVRAIFEGMDKIDIKNNLDFYRQKASEAKSKCGAFAFVGISGLKSVLFNYVIIFAGMPMRMVPTLADAEAWVSAKVIEMKA